MTPAPIKPTGNSAYWLFMQRAWEKLWGNESRFISTATVKVNRSSRGTSWDAIVPNVSGGAGATVKQFQVITENPTTLICAPVAGGANVTVLKPLELQNSIATQEAFYGLNIVYTPLFINQVNSANKRTMQVNNTAGLPVYNCVIFPGYVSTAMGAIGGIADKPNYIWAIQIPSTSGTTWLDLNVAGREWFAQIAVCAQTVVNGAVVNTASIALIRASGIYTVPISFSSI